MPSKSTVTAPVTITSMYERLATTIDLLMEQKITPEHGNAIANAAEKMAIFAKLECQMADLALSNERTLVSSGFMPELEDQSEIARRQNRLTALSGKVAR